LILDKKQSKKQQMDISMIVLVGFGVIDILFKRIALTTTLPFIDPCSFCYFASSYDSCSNLRTGKKNKIILSIYF
jgi:hypothetical protein